jgi:hypothetical protein
MQRLGTPNVHERLREAHSFLETLEHERRIQGDPTLDRASEQRIIQRELLDLEFQDIDDQIDKLWQLSASIGT